MKTEKEGFDYEALKTKALEQLRSAKILNLESFATS